MHLKLFLNVNSSGYHSDSCEDVERRISEFSRFSLYEDAKVKINKLPFWVDVSGLRNTSALIRFAATLPAIEILREEIKGKPERYLERYYVGHTPDWIYYLHRFVSSDSTGWHNHPWPAAISVLLQGPYCEETLVDIAGGKVISRHRVSGQVGYLTRESFHRVVIPEGLRTKAKDETWTLFMNRNKWVQGWGFFLPASPVDKMWNVGGEKQYLRYAIENANAVQRKRDWWVNAKTGKQIWELHPKENAHLIALVS